jgi:hypothetical protein
MYGTLVHTCVAMISHCSIKTGTTHLFLSNTTHDLNTLPKAHEASLYVTAWGPVEVLQIHTVKHSH